MLFVEVPWTPLPLLPKLSPLRPSPPNLVWRLQIESQLNICSEERVVPFMLFSDPPSFLQQPLKLKLYFFFSRSQSYHYRFSLDPPPTTQYALWSVVPVNFKHL
jgi:hypothetical protein